MKSPRFASPVVVASAIFIGLSAILGAVPWRFAAAAPPPSAALKTSSIAKSVTVFPIVLTVDTPAAQPPQLPPGMSKNLAEWVGLFLERGGMKQIEIADAKFSPPEKADLTTAAEAFGQFVRSQKLSTQYALFGQFLGIPRKGVDEIRLVVVDRQGKVILAELRDREQLSRLGGVDLLLASYHLVCRLRPLWGLADPSRKDAPEGKMARLAAEKSGLPSRAEREAIHSRLNTWRKSIKTSTVAVFPVHVSGRSDAKVAVALAEMLSHEGLVLCHS
jgi:hypothetical protein